MFTESFINIENHPIYWECPYSGLPSYDSILKWTLLFSTIMPSANILSQIKASPTTYGLSLGWYLYWSKCYLIIPHLRVFGDISSVSFKTISPALSAN